MKAVKNINILIILIAVIITAVLFIFFRSKHGAKTDQSDQAGETALVAKSYSRVSLFNTQKVRVSLAVPDYWEGNYRIKESGQTVFFYYIGSGEEIKMFAIHLELGAPAPTAENRLVLEDGPGFALSYELFAQPGLNENPIFTQMAKDRDGVIKSRKIN